MTVPNLIDRMEENLFDAQLARLARVTGAQPHAEFLREMFALVRKQYVEELKRRGLRLHPLEGARLDEVVSYVFYYHRFYTSHLPPETVEKLERDEKYRAVLVSDVAVYIVINEH